MTANAISAFCCHLPIDPRASDALRKLAGDIPFFDLEDPSLQFAQHYHNLEFGWDVAKALAKAHKPFPDTTQEIVWRAYLFCCHSKLYYDEDIVGAMMLHTTPTFGRRREMLAGLLVSKDMTIEKAADHLNMNPGTVRAYEQLFFNILDRKRDLAMLAETIYPETRLVELIAKYMDNESLGSHLLRFGYNNGPEEVLYYAGMNNDVLNSLAHADSPQRLKAVIMSHGFLMARNNLLQPQGFFQAAKGLLAAEAQGGATSGDVSPVTGNISDAIMGELSKMKGLEADTRARANINRIRTTTLDMEVLPA